MAERIEPVEEFPPVPMQLLWMFDGIDRKQATKMMHDYARSAITWKPSKALLRAWEDVQTATDKARRLEDENERLRAEVSAWRERLGDDYEYRPDVPYVVMKTPNASFSGAGTASAGSDSST